MSEQKNNIDQMLNIGLGVGAIFSMAIKKYSYSYVIFTFLLGWNIMSNFVSGSGTTGMTPTKMAYLFFSIILFFSTFYLTILTFKKSKLFDTDLNSGDLPFYVKTSNIFKEDWLLLIMYLLDPFSPFNFCMDFIARIELRVDTTKSSSKEFGEMSPLSFIRDFDLSSSFNEI